MRAPPRKQVLVAALGLAAFGALGEASAWALVATYVASLGLLELSHLDPPVTALPRRAFATLAVALMAPGVILLVRERDAWLAYEGLDGIAARARERIAHERDVVIAPELIVADRPQTFFVRTPARGPLRVQLGTSARELAAEPVTPGLFRVDYDPRRDGPPTPPDGVLSAFIRSDGDEIVRTLQAVTPLAHPRWLVTAPGDELAATVSEETDELIVVSPRGVERRVPVGDGPVDCAFIDAQHVAVSHRDEDRLWVIDVRDGSHALGAPIGRPMGRLVASPDGTRLAVAQLGSTPALVLVDAATQAVVQHLPLAVPLDWLAFGPDASTLVASSRRDATLRAFRSDGQRLAQTEQQALGRAAVTLGRARDGSYLLVATTDDRRDGSPNLGNHFIQDQLLAFALSPLRVTAILLTARRTPRQSKPGDVDRGISPMGLSQGRDGTWLLTFAGSEELWSLRDLRSAPQVVDLGDKGVYAPHGVAELADGTWVVSSPSAGVLALLPSPESEPELLRVAPASPFLEQHHPLALLRRLGERAFYEGTRSGISCQSCHMHADSDEAAHNLGLHRLLPTLSVRGLLGTAPYLRDGSFGRVGDLDHVSQTLYRGFLRKAPARAASLEAFVLSLPRRASRAQRDPSARAREQRGATVFARAGCATCHTPPSFTHLGQHLATDLFPERGPPESALEDVLDTPTLLSIGATAPYLSDGRAHSLEQVLIDHNRENHHGDTAGLSAGERLDLSSFLESL
jgi:hypothetical protein